MDLACQAYTELETVNDPDTNTVSATVDPAADDITATESEGTSVQSAGSRLLGAEDSGDSTVIGAVDSGTGPGGSFKATPLASTGSWSHAGSSGAFVWSYPLTVPAAPAGPTPKVALTYNSQSVDGRTGVSSPQASWIGEGWDYDPGHIERRYRSCKDDRKTLDAGAPNNTAKANKTSDLCWVSHNAVMSLAGRSTELVRVGNTNTYRPASDDGSRVTLKTGATNGDNDGEYWEVTTTDGTVYTFGRHEVGGGHADTNSVSTVPVFGNHPGEPCHTTAFADSRCGAGKQQAWRWGLDKVADVHGNVMVVNWKQETNYYAVRDKRKTPEAYERFAYPTTIDYGMRSGDLSKPSAQVSFGAKQRCLKSTTACDAANFAKTDDPGAYRPWWDTPGNLNCKSTSKLCPGFPSFWTQMRLDTVTTLGARPGVTGLGKVDVYALHQSFPSDWYDTSPGLWLNSITRTGFGPGDTTGTVQSKDGVSFAEYRVGSSSPLQSRLRDRQLPNLVRTGPKDQRPAFTRPRIGTVATEAGADIEVEYTGGCATPPAEGPKPASWPDRRSYLGTGVDDAATGLTHIGARGYDQANGRFISADPLLDITDPLQMKGYSYAKNSPISTSDPDGLKPVTDCYRGCSDGPDGLYRDWMVPDGSGGWKYEGAVYTYDVVGDLHSVYRFGGHHPPMGTRTVIKPYDTKAQKNSFKFIASLVIPDVESWKKVISGEANGWDYLGIATDLPFAKVLKLVPDSVVKEGKGAVEDWLRKFTSPGCKCFLAGTEVLMADGETKKIENIEVGDEVVATNPETGETGLRKVTRLIVTEDDKHFNELTVETPDGRERLTATHEHPFWVPEIGAWVEARNLAAGMTLRTPDGTTVRVLSNRAYTKHARTYNLTVDDLHTYYVLAGETPALVHNSNCPGIGRELIGGQEQFHIIHGDRTGGGHKWPGQPGKTVFPRGWDTDKILDSIVEVATSPNSVWTQQTGRAGALYTRNRDPSRWKVEGVVDGVNIRVIYEPATDRIVTGFPYRP